MSGLFRTFPIYNEWHVWITVGCHSLAGQSVRPVAQWAELAQLSVERSRVALQDHLRNLPDRGALLDEPTSESDLLRRQLRWPAKAHTPRLGRNPPRAGSLVDERPLELRN